MRRPLQVKLKKDTPWIWKESDTAYVERIKKQVKDLPVLYHPGRKDQMIIETDASKDFWGVVLKAKTDSGEQLCRYT